MSPRIRAAGNYRAGWPCYRAGGNICYADTPVGRNREHAILQAERCVAVNPSDTAPALIALDAKFVVATPKGEQVVDAEDYFVGPDLDITRMNILGRTQPSIRQFGGWLQRAGSVLSATGTRNTQFPRGTRPGSLI
jgi:hypothetical protein